MTTRRFLMAGVLIFVTLSLLGAESCTPRQPAGISNQENALFEALMDSIVKDPAYKTTTPQVDDNRETCLQRFEKGEMLIDFDEKGIGHFFVLKQGVLEAQHRDGKITVLKNPDTYFCALFSFLEDASFVRITAKEPSDVYLFPADMRKLSEISPTVANTLVRKLLLLVKKREKQLEVLRAG
ncbi:hypothetical protein ACFL1X_05595 [Candidatus Hydrogenedentota bacterium]